MPIDPLPVDAHLDAVRAHLARHRAVVVTAAPGAGKTTRIPPALIDRGPVIVLQPRRVAARAVARRIAAERDWTIGSEIGWQIRFERRFSRQTEVLVVTEGILTARLQQDPLLSGFATVVFDEFHERSIHSDLGLAFARQAWRARDDLRLVVMSATLDAGAVSRFLGDCPTVEVPGRLHPLTVEYAPHDSMADAVLDVTQRASGDVLCFLPGAREIADAERALSDALVRQRIEVVPLHGSLDGDSQDRALTPGDTRRVILATNIAETSLTVPRVAAVVDSGWHKVARYDHRRAIDTLALERVPQDSADQRAGRAARLGPGLVKRLWDRQQRLLPHREPEIARVDLAGAVLDVLAWGGRLDEFEWFDPPPATRLADARRLLERLGAISGGQLTPLGRAMQRIPAHPRIARILMDGGAAPEVARACAALSEPSAARGAGGSQLARIAGELQRTAAALIDGGPALTASDREVRHALFAGYADRLARRRPGSESQVVLASGHGAMLARECPPIASEYLVALDVVASERGGVSEALIRDASGVDAEWITPTSSAVEHRFDRASGRVRAFAVERYDALVLRERPVAVDRQVAAQMLAEEWLAAARDAETLRLIRRARFAGLDLDLRALATSAALGAVSLAEIDLASQLSYEMRHALESHAPDRLPLPSGRTAQLDYADDGSVAASVKLQELFGLAETPRIGIHRVPVTFHLLAPNGRAVQTTRDLRSFWERTYPEVRRELRGRYPKHPWPEDPWTATPTHRTTRRVRRD